MGEKIDIVCVGNCAVDVPLKPVDEKIFSVDSYPIERIAPTVGGSAANVSVISSRLGKKVAISALVGDDMLGRFILDYCRENNIDVSSVAVDKNVETPLSVGLVRADGERTFVVSKASSTFRFCIDDIDLDRLKDARLLDVASIFINPKLDGAGLVRLFEAAKKADLVICADMMKSRDGKRLAAIRDAMAYVDYFFPNYEEAAFLTERAAVEDIANELLAAGVKNVVIKNGKQGCFIKNKETSFTVPAFLNDAPVDTIGAGDNFVAGFLCGILDGLDIKACAKFANAVASISVSAAGATNGVREKKQVDDFIARFENASGNGTRTRLTAETSWVNKS